MVYYIPMRKRFIIKVHGKVQGVYFRHTTQRVARKLHLKGFVKNEEEGSVRIEAVGDSEQLKKLVEWCHQGSPHSIVDRVSVRVGTMKPYDHFSIK